MVQGEEIKVSCSAYIKLSVCVRACALRAHTYVEYISPSAGSRVGQRGRGHVGGTQRFSAVSLDPSPFTRRTCWLPAASTCKEKEKKKREAQLWSAEYALEGISVAEKHLLSGFHLLKG